jgi:hypothetical protein
MRKLLLISMVLALFGQVMLSQRQTCTNAEADKAEQEAETLRTWDALYKSYLRFGKCDDGAIADGYSESVARILVDHWDTLPRLAVLSRDTKQFQKFVLSHVDATLNMDDVKKIRANAAHTCPKGQSDLCKQLTVAADRAIEN